MPSDIAAGIVLLYHKQRRGRRLAASMLARSSSSSSSLASSAGGSGSVGLSMTHAGRSAAAAGRGVGWGGKRRGRGKGGSGYSSPVFSPPSAGRDVESQGERLSLNGGWADGGVGGVGGGGGGGAGAGGVLPLGLRARSVDHEDFFRVDGLSLLDVTNPADEKALAEISHFSRYALAIYTW